MISKDFEFIIASPIDKEKLVCEIYYKGEEFGEVSQENNELLIELYSSKKSKYWEIPLINFQEAFENAKNHLLSKPKT